MHLDADCLREAKTVNLERLARALGIRLPDAPASKSYGRRLVRAVLKGIRQDQDKARPSLS
jgi:hypothetical protein